MLRRFNKLQVENRWKAYEKRAADFQLLCEVRRRESYSMPERDDGENQYNIAIPHYVHKSYPFKCIILQLLTIHVIYAKKTVKPHVLIPLSTN